MSDFIDLPKSLDQRRALLQQEIEREVRGAKLPLDLEAKVLVQLCRSPSDDGARMLLLGLIVLYTFEAAGGQRDSAAYPAAVGVEILAAAASVLDDLQDNDPVGALPDANPGNAAEFVTLLLTLAHRSILGHGEAFPSVEREVFQKLTQYELAALAGQHASNALSDGADTIDASLSHSAEKSGSFGRLAGELGALLAGATKDQVSSLGEFGWHLLVIDQMQNDVAGIWPGRLKGTDLTEDRMTVPIAFSRRIRSEETPLDGERPAADDRDPENPEDLERSRIYQSGGVHYAWIVAARHRFQAEKLAERFSKQNPGSLLGDLLE